MRSNSKIFFLIFFLICTTLSAQQMAVVNDHIKERVFFLKELAYLIDSTNTFSFEQISSAAFLNKFGEHNSYQNKDFETDMSYWIRFPVRQNVHSEKDWLIEFYDQTIDHLEVYVPEANGSYKKLLMGDQYPFSRRTFDHKNFEIRIPRPKADTLTVYYFKVKSRDFADIRVAFKSIDRFVYYAISEYFLYGTFYGMILIIALYNFLVYLAIKEIKNIYYIFYILSVGLYTLSLDGIGFQYLWPEHPEWNNYASGITLYMVIISTIIFTRKFLSTPANSPRLDNLLKGMIVARTGVFLFELFFFPQFFVYRIIEIIPLSLTFYAGIKVWYRGYRPARFFVIAYGILFTGFFIRILVYLNFIPMTILSHYSLHISFVLEMLFLTFALGDRIRILKAMRDRALNRTIQQHEVNMKLMDKVNRELETKVKERTAELDQKNHELEESNQKLVRQAKEINQINSILDLDNWKLKNSLKEVLNERLLDKTMDYKQFQTLYPDKLACYRFLESLKWGKNFHCKKCGNEKYFDGSQKFSRRCTRCGYNESITAYTIFHSLKFPIEKAFYIAYVAVLEKNDHTLEMFANELTLRVNTIWSFKRKVIERIADLTTKGRKPHASKWEDVVLLQEPHHESIKNRRKKLNLPVTQP
ncbi:MAG TPA: 7TM diverse intracellular signaling domain-containing protein [Cyclobacteriaceae bacterium]|nr:7TM diverse intracellular signaling domain-containing protein [Cyclobacteriaceae bacterium]